MDETVLLPILVGPLLALHYAGCVFTAAGLFWRDRPVTGLVAVLAPLPLVAAGLGLPLWIALYAHWGDLDAIADLVEQIATDDFGPVAWAGGMLLTLPPLLLEAITFALLARHRPWEVPLDPP